VSYDPTTDRRSDLPPKSDAGNLTLRVEFLRFSHVVLNPR
jgi:hypothetical protein